MNAISLPTSDRACAEAQGAGVLTIDVEAVARNYALLRDRAAGVAVAGVVKADAYGLGVDLVAPRLFEAGCRTFFVAHPAEALTLRRLLPDGAEILVLNGVAPGDEHLCAEGGVRPVLNSLDQIEAFGALGRRLRRRLPAAIQVDSGMSRLGLSPAEVETIAVEPGRLDGIETVLVMSHLACADEPAHPANEAQLAAFQSLSARLPKARRSLANSAGVFLGPRFHFDLVRPGIALYGGAPTGGRPNPMEATARLDARVVQIRDVPAGAGIGYGFTAVAERPMRLATLSVGYADGWLRSMSERGAAFFEGVRLPVVGRVSMDSVIVDAAETRLRTGDLVELIGPHQTIDEVAARAGTISYEILTSLGTRYERRAAGSGSKGELA